MKIKEETFTIKVTMKRRWVPHFLGMLEKMEYLGNIGASRKIGFYSDGDGDFHPHFKWNTKIMPVKGQGKEELFFDAG